MAGNWDPQLFAVVIMTDHGGNLSGVAWQRAVREAGELFAGMGSGVTCWHGSPDSPDRSACFQFGYGTADRLFDITVLLAEIAGRIACARVTLTTGTPVRVQPPVTC
jgi:hypothetical protein